MSEAEQRHQIDEAEKAVEQWKVKKLIQTLEAARGNGTSMISLIIPPKDQISRVSKMLNDEMGTATNIKSRVNRLSVLGAITSTVQRLKLYTRVPTNGLVVYCGTVITAEGKEKKINIDFEPFKPINTSLYLCDNKFHTEALNELLESDDKFGFIIMDGNGALFGVLSGNTRTVLHKFSVDLPKKHGRGGQSALRFARLRLEKRHNYLRKVAETAVQMFIQNDRPNVAGLILAGSAEFKQKLSQSDLFDIRLQAIVTKIVDVSYGGENGFNQAIELAADSLLNVKFIREKKLLSTYFGEIAKDSQKYCLTAESQVTMNDQTQRSLIDMQSMYRVMGHWSGSVEGHADAAWLSGADLQQSQSTSTAVVAASVHSLIPRHHAQQCIDVVLADGREVRCTLNHPVLTQDGYLEAALLDPSVHQVQTTIRGIRDPTSMITEFEIDASAIDTDTEDSVSVVRRDSCDMSSFSQWSLDSAFLGHLSEQTVDSRWQLFGLGCLTGYFMQDVMAGRFDASGHSANISNALDREQVQTWVSQCSKLVATVDGDLISIPADVCRAILELSDSSSVVPSAVSSECPRSLRIGFLRGLFGSNGSAPQFDADEDSFSPVSLDLESADSLHSVSQLLDSLQIKSHVDAASGVLRLSKDSDEATFTRFVSFGAASLQSLRLEVAQAAKTMQRFGRTSKTMSQTLTDISASAIFTSADAPLIYGMPVNRIELAGKYDVYDLCVPLTSSFNTCGMIVHNCFGVKDTLAALELGAVEELIVWEALDINRFVLKNKETGAESTAYLNEKQEKEGTFLKDPLGVELEVVDKLSLLEWLANNFKSFGAKLQFVTNKSQEGSQFVRGFGGIGGLLRYQVDFLTMDTNDDFEDDFI